MRELRFRAKRLDNGEWVKGANILAMNTENPAIVEVYMFASGAAISTQEADGSGNLRKVAGKLYKVDPETVGQFTDLTDCYGTQIYEGDIVKLTDKYYETEWTAKVVFGNPYAQYSWGWNFQYIGKKPQVNTDILLWVEMAETGVHCEIIGNVHDNPELLKGV